MTVHCHRCGATFSEEVTFCGRCGARLPAAGAPGPVPPEADPLVGHIVDGRYRVLAKLGEGGMGAVYKVEHVHIGKYMAMKLLLREFSGNRDLVRRFRREAQAVSRLSHENTVQVFDFGRSADGAMYMVMEYIQGENLASVLAREGPMTVARTARIVGQVCGSLSEAHGLGIVHRDLKPENVMLARRRERRDFVKVLDFGLAKLREKGERDEGATSHGSLVGTPYYMSPEQIQGKPIDPRSDIYSLGAMIYKMLTGDPPFRAPSPIAVLTKHLHDTPPPLREARPDLEASPAIEAVVRRAMAKRPEARFQTVDELRHALEGAVAAGGATTSTITPRSRELLSFEEEAPESSWASDMIGNRLDFDRFRQRLQRRRRFRLAMLFVVLGATGGAFAWGYLKGGWFERTTESEPNNKRREATRLHPGKPLRGYIGKRLSDDVGDVDWYELRHRGGRNLAQVEVTGVPNIDLVVEAFRGGDSKEPFWVANETGVGGRERLPNLAFDRTLYFRVREVPMKGKVPTENISDAYVISAEARPWRPGEEAEPNEDVFTATDAPVGAPVTGLFARRGDRDYFRFLRTGEAGERFRIELSGVPGVEVEARVVAGGQPVLDRLPGEVTLPAGDRQLFVALHATRGANLDTPYTLRVTRVR